MKLSLYILCFVALFSGYKAVEWNGNNWALGCDFKDNNLSNERAKGEQCGGLCGSKSGCTHWSFNGEHGGTCYLKQGSVTKNDARGNNDWSTSCGVISESTNPDTTKGPGGVTNNPIPAGSALNKFTKCKFSYGRDWVGNVDYTPYDYVTIWINTPAQNCAGPQCTDYNQYHQGAMLNKVKQLGKIPVFYAYVIAFEARNAWGLKDCDVGYPSLCQRGVKYIKENRDRIIERYSHHAAAFAGVIGREGFSVWLIEPDFWQFYGDDSQEGGNLSGNDMRSLFDDMVSAIKTHLPNAAISWDISAWISEQAQRDWWGYFSSSPHIDFIHTSGGQPHGDKPNIKPGELGWRFMSDLTGKKIIADSGYGVAGNPLDNREPWYQQWNVDARRSEGVISVSIAGSQKNPSYRPNIC